MKRPDFEVYAEIWLKIETKEIYVLYIKLCR